MGNFTMLKKTYTFRKGEKDWAFKEIIWSESVAKFIGFREEVILC